MIVACAAAETAEPFPVTDVAVDGDDLTVWVADEGGERRQGLRGMEELPSDIDGMLFVYDRPQTVTFVMDDTLIPLDVWWFDEGGLLIAGNSMSPCESRECGEYQSPGPVAWVLETASGTHDFPVGASLSTGESD